MKSLMYETPVESEEDFDSQNCCGYVDIAEESGVSASTEGSLWRSSAGWAYKLGDIWNKCCSLNDNLK